MSEPKSAKAFSGEVLVVTEIADNLGTMFAVRKKLTFKDGMLEKVGNAPKQEICKTAQRR